MADRSAERRPPDARPPRSPSSGSRTRLSRRRTVLAGAAAIAAGLPGCSGLLNGSDPGSSGPDDPTATWTDVPTAADAPSTPTATPALNQTPHPVVQQGEPRDKDPDAFPLLDDGNEVSLGLLTSPDWRELVNEAVLADASGSFVSATDFGTETVVAFETRFPDLPNRLILRSVDGVGTASLHLSIRELHWGGDVANGTGYRMLLVRVPNRGIEPAGATATVDYDEWGGEDPVTVSTDG